jgi:hypothetical protein
MSNFIAQQQILIRKNKMLETENAKLKQFARDIIWDECWDLGGSQSRDGATVQDQAEQLGMIVKDKATSEDVEAHAGLFDLGDDIYRLADWMKE